LILFLEETVPSGAVPFEIQPIPFPSRGADLTDLSESLASTRIHDPLRPPERIAPMYAEVQAERNRVLDSDSGAFGMVYDGLELLRLYSGLLETADGAEDILLTNRVVGTYDRDDRRIHARVAVFGVPPLISVPGLVAAPARPVEAALSRRLGLKARPERLDGSEEFLVYGDPRTTEVLKGIVLQAVFYLVSGNPFCPDRDCRLFNAHRQKDLLHAQCRPGASLCDAHAGQLERLLGAD
jgi:hypothetical protein